MANYSSRKYINILGEKKRVLCGFNENRYGEAIVITGIPREFKRGVITYTDLKTESYENYIARKSLKRR